MNKSNWTAAVLFVLALPMFGVTIAKAQEGPAPAPSQAAEEETINRKDAQNVFEVLLMTYREGSDSESEKKVLYGSMDWLHISEKEFDLIFEKVKKSDEKWTPRVAKSHGVQSGMVYAQVRLIIADGEVSENEERVAGKVREKVNLSEEEYDAIVQQAVKDSRG